VNPRATVALLAVLVVLGAVAIVVQGPCSADRQREHAALLPGFAAADVTLIRANRAGSELLLARDGGAWKLGASKEPADGAAVEALLAGLAATRVGAVVSTNVAKQTPYETDAGQGVAVRLEGAGGKLLAAFVVGKRGPDFASCYLRREGSAEVLLVSRDLRADFARPAESWREPPKKSAEPSASGPPAGHQGK
jgi:hypothetical protein